MGLLAVMWNVNPVFFELFGISVRWYSLVFASVFLGGYFLVKGYTKQAVIPDKVYDFWLLYMVIGGIVGARLGHVLFYDFDYYSHHLSEIGMTWRGGMASHGGALGVLVSLWILSRQYKLSYLWVLDKISAAVALGGALLRFGNLLNSEIFGCPTDLPWGFVFVKTDPDQVSRHPTQIYEAICYFFVFLTIHCVDRKYRYQSPSGRLVSILLIGVFGARFLIEFVKEPQVDFESVMLLNLGQWLSLPFILAGAALMVKDKIQQGKTLK